jgi:surface protein
MNKIYLSGNYVIVEKDGNVYEYPRTLSVYTIQGSNYVIKERIDDGQFVLPIADIGTYFDEAGAIAYTEATLVTFLRENTGFKTAGGGSPAEFIMLVKTDNAGISASDSFIIPTSGAGYNYNVDWGDGNFSSGVTGSVQHTYSSIGTYTIKISGDFPAIYFNNGGDRQKLLEIQNWGNIAWNIPARSNGAFKNSFQGCINMELTATDSPDLSAVVSMYYMLRACTSMVGNSSMNNWNTSNVQNFLGCFSASINFNSPIGNWDMSSATILQSMFQSASSFNQDIGSWNVQNVTNANSMFNGATNFNNGGSSSIGNWNTSNLGNQGINQMFFRTSFNQDIGNWDISNVIGSNANIFRETPFNHYLGNWQLNTGLTSLAFMFYASGMSTANYTDTLVAWANQVITNGGPFNLSFAGQVGRTFDTSRSGGVNFATAGDARTYLTTATPTGAGWTISSDTVI